MSQEETIASHQHEEIAVLRDRVHAAEDALRAIRNGEVDAFVVDGRIGPEIFTLHGLDGESSRLRGDILAQISDCIVAFDVEGRVTYLNAAAERQYGVRAAEAVGESQDELFQIRWLDSGDEKAAARALMEKGSWSGETVHVLRDGRASHVETAMIQMRDRAGTVIGRLMTDAAPIMLAHCDRDHRYKFVNQPYAERFGLKREEIIGRTVAEVLGEEAYQKVRGHIDRALGGATVEFEIEMKHARLGLRYLSVAYAPERDEKGSVVGMVGAVLDITERKQTELRLAEQARLLDLSFDAIFVRDSSDRITYWNKGAEEAYGFTRGEAIGRSPHELLRTEFPEPLEEISRQLFRDGRWIGELVHTRKNGTRVTDASRWALDRDARGHASSVLETNTDISARKQAQEQLRASEQRLCAIYDGTHAYIGLLSPSGILLDVNHSALAFAGIRREDAVGRPFWRRFGFVALPRSPKRCAVPSRVRRRANRCVSNLR